jgi:Delta7-sterol 5-desaturase
MKWETFIWLLLDNATKYYFIALPFFLVFYVFFRGPLSHKKIQKKFPKFNDYFREIGFSTVSVIIFSLPPLIMLYNDNIRPYTTFYKQFDEHSTLYFVLAFPLMFLMHDTYFYWAHRLMHNPWLFKKIHLVHHRSTNPSPWAAYAFHPFEAIVESLIFTIILLTIPVHTIHLMTFFVLSLVYNVYGHLGFEIYPKGFNKHWFGKWINTSVSHNLHHQYFNGNYGLYFTIWDRMMGTMRPDYDASFENLKLREKTSI